MTLTNSLDNGTKSLGVTFAGINKTGDNIDTISVTENIAVAEITNALFGTWSGTIMYSVAMSDIEGAPQSATESSTMASDPVVMDEDEDAPTDHSENNQQEIAESDNSSELEE